MEEMPFAQNYGTASHIYHKLKDAIYDILFDLNLDKSIYISNESEASYLARSLAVDCCETLDEKKYIKWSGGNLDILDRKVTE